jgi:hypothetical protein
MLLRKLAVMLFLAGVPGIALLVAACAGGFDPGESSDASAGNPAQEISANGTRVDSVPASSANVLTARANNARTGQYYDPKITVAALSQQSGTQNWGWIKRYTFPDGAAVWAQPLYVQGVTINGAVHNVVYVATATNYIYAFDADNPEGGNALLQKILLPAPDGGGAGVPTYDSTDQDFNYLPQNADAGALKNPCFLTSIPSDGGVPSFGAGVVSTPVIDPTGSYMYVSYRTRRNMTTDCVDQTIAKIRLSNALGTDGGAAVVDTYTLKDSPPAGGDTSCETGPVPATPDVFGDIRGLRQRAALLLENNLLYISFSLRTESWFEANAQEIGDSGTYTYKNPEFLGIGQVAVIGTQSTTDNSPKMAGGIGQVRSLGTFSLPTSPYGGGIWQGGSGPIADTAGNVYFATGNAIHSGGSPTGDFNASSNELTDSIVRLTPSLSVVNGQTTATFQTNPNGKRANQSNAYDWFTPYRHWWLDATDMDLAASGPMLIPGTSTLVQVGKEGLLYVLNGNDLGGFDETVTDAGTAYPPWTSTT